MKKIIFVLMMISTALIGKSAMYVCYGNENNCFGSNGDCDDLDIECSTEPDDYSIGGCNCTQLGVLIIPTLDEFSNVRTFKVSGSSLQILNAEGTTWTSLWDIATISDDEYYDFRYVASLNRVVITRYFIEIVESVVSEGAPYDFSSACVDQINVYYAD